MLNVLLERHPITPRIADHNPANLHIHVANKAASVADLLIGESLLGLANLVCDLGPTRLGVCAATPVHQRLRRHLAQPVAPVLLRALLLPGQRRRLPRPAEGCCGLTRRQLTGIEATRSEPETRRLYAS